MGKDKMSCSYQNRNPDFSASGTNTVSSFILIVVTDFGLIVLDFEILTLNDER
jgi:hypothetical protein